MGKKSQVSRNLNAKKAENVTEPNRTISTKKRKQLDRLVDDLLKQVVVQTPNNETLWAVFKEVNRILDLIKSLEPPEEAQPKNRQGAVDNFKSWIKENGVNCHDIDICEFPQMGLGLKAKKSFNRGDLILNVPRKLMLTEECAKQSILGNLITKDPILKYMPNVTLAMYLLLKKFSADPFWKAYLDILPPTYSTVLYFSLEELLELKGSGVWPGAVKLCINIARQFAYFHKMLHTSHEPVALQMKDHFTYNQYRWAVSTVMTRQNVVPPSAEGPLSTPALIPLWDLCNHTQGEITTNFDQATDQAECFAVKDFKEGEQIFIFYGVRTNAFFFLHNGFVYPENQEDSLEVGLGTSPQDPLQPLKLALLARLPPPPYVLRAPPSAPLSPPLLAFARVQQMDKEELTSWLSEGAHSELLAVEGVEGAALSPALQQLDRRALAFLHTRCKLLLACLQRDAESRENLAQDGSQANRTLVRNLKKCEMNILQSAIDFTKPKL